MQKLIKSRIMYFILGVVLSVGITSVFAYSIFAPDVGFTPRDDTWNVDNSKDALDDLHETCDYCKTRFENLVWDFPYEGKQHVFDVPLSGVYILEVWGAQGGSATISGTNTGGYGGYSIGTTTLTKGEKLYINVGGQGAGNNGSSNVNIAGGYNGGGYGRQNGCRVGGGGGATHIAKVSGVLSSLSSYKDTGGTNLSNEILIVSGGGAGAYRYNSGGDARNRNGISGGGIQGYSTHTGGNSGYQGTQTGGFGFGTGGFLSSSVGTGDNKSGGGGGWYGGTPMWDGHAGGGSGYIASPNLKSVSSVTKHMTCYSCTTSDAESTKTNTTTNVSGDPVSDYAKSGHGYARITILGVG